MKFLLTADIHLSDNPRDAYRFELFTWLRQQQETYKTDAIMILGDLTTEKNNHSAELVNKIVGGLRLLNPPILILKGNHDYIREDLPFFKFLNSIEGITFCTDPSYIEEYNIYMVPHQTSQAAFDTAFLKAPQGCLLTMHATITGAISETGARLTGLTVPPNKARALYAGDIHKPQKNGQVTYIGAPFHIRHGDQYEPRVLLLN